MISECLANLIGIRGLCDDTTPLSELFVNDLSGVSLKSIASLTNEEQEDYKGVWDEIYQRSLNQLEGDILARMQKFFKTNILLDHETFGFYKSTYATEASSNQRKGIAIDLIGSKHTEIFINNVELRLESVTNTVGVITIFNYNDGRVLDTITFTAVEGVNDIAINKRYSSFGQRTRIFISYDGNIAAAIQSSSTSYTDVYGFAVTKGAKIAVGTSVVKNNISFDGETHGMVINYNVFCSVSNFICSNKDLFKLALWYKVGQNFMDERLISTRINKYTLLNKERAEFLYDEFKKQYEENLNTVLDNMDLQGDDVCFPCQKSRMSIVNLP